MAKDNAMVLKKFVLAVLGEFLSTSFLVMLGCMGCTPINGVAATAIAGGMSFGIAVMFNIQIFGHVSGAHMNPAVTLGAVLMNVTPPLLGVAYLIAQCAGSTFGFWLLTQSLPDGIFPRGTGYGVCTTALQANVSITQAVLIEGSITAILIWFNCALCWDPIHKKDTEGIPVKFFLLILGLSMMGGPYTGASMNPARSLGPAIVNNDWNQHWIYWVAPLGTAIICSFTYKLLFHSNIGGDVIDDILEEKPLEPKNKSIRNV